LFPREVLELSNVSGIIPPSYKIIIALQIFIFDSKNIPSIKINNDNTL